MKLDKEPSPIEFGLNVRNGLMALRRRLGHIRHAVISAHCILTLQISLFFQIFKWCITSLCLLKLFTVFPLIKMFLAKLQWPIGFWLQWSSFVIDILLHFCIYPQALIITTVTKSDVNFQYYVCSLKSKFNWNPCKEALPVGSTPSSAPVQWLVLCQSEVLTHLYYVTHLLYKYLLCQITGTF